MTEHENDGTQASKPPVPPLVAAYERIMAASRDSGRTVTESEEESDGTEYQVTFPQKRAPVTPPSPGAERASSHGPVKVTVYWGNDDVEASIEIPSESWQEIKEGERWGGESTYSYEGEEFTADWHFNCDGKGTLRVTYDDGGEGFIGDISEAYIEE